MLIIIIPSFLLFIIIILFSAIVYILKNPEKLDRWVYLVNKLKIKKDLATEKKIISSNLNYKINSISKRINKEADGIIPYGLRIIWKNIHEVESFVQKNEVVVVLKKEDNNDKNIVDACMSFVPKSVLPKSRNCIDANVLCSIDQYVVKTILNQGSYDSAYNYYLNNHFALFLKANSSYEKYIEEFDKLDALGFFTRVLLEEYRRLGNKLYGTLEENKYKEESVKFLEFLNDFAKRKPGDKTKLYFTGDKIKMAILLLSKKETLMKWGIDGYIKKIQDDIDYGAQRVFVFSYDQPVDVFTEDSNGFIIDYIKKRDFKNLNLLEKECNKIASIRLIKKQTYNTKDVTGRPRKAKYLLYESLR